jgi:hypothetical protein
MAPVEGRSSSMHITAGTVQQYRHAYKLTDFIISRTAHQDLFRESQNASNRRTERGTIRVSLTLSFKLDVGRPALASSFCVNHLPSGFLRTSPTRKIIRHRDTEVTEVWFPWSLLRALRASVVNFHSYGWAEDPCGLSGIHVKLTTARARIYPC